MYQIGYDIGSSSVKVALINSQTQERLVVLHEPQQEMDIKALHNDWAEQDPEIWWKHLCTATKKAILQSGIDASEITAIGISYQMHGLVCVDRQGNPLRNAIIWCDSRAVDIGNKAFSDLGEPYCMSHLLNSPGNFTASKLKWVQENEPATYASIYKYMLPGDYIAYKLTDRINTTKNGLSEGMLWDYKNNKVATALLDYYGIDHNLTPDIVENFTDQGEVTAEAAEITGLPIGAKVTYRAGDQPNNALSLNVFKPGEVAATGGTSGVIYAVTDTLTSTESSRINHFAHVNYTNKKPTVGKLLNINGAGIQYRWLLNNCVESSYEAMNVKASKVPIGSDGVVVLPFGNGAERMFNNKNIGTHFCNLNLNVHSDAHLYRAALEGIAFSFVYGMEILKNDNAAITVIRAGNDNLFRSEIFAQTVATLIDHAIEIYDTTGAVGAAKAAGLNHSNFEQFVAGSMKNDLVQTIEPMQQKESYVKAYHTWKNELQIHLKHTS